MQHLIACHECDVVQREVSLSPGAQARCVRCGAQLYRRPRGGFDRSLALALAALVLLAIANAFPVVSLEVSGQRTDATLIGAARALHGQGMGAVGALVLGTAVVAPAVIAAVAAYTLFLLRLGRIPPGFIGIMRFGGYFGPWGMIEVFMLGVLVSLVKLSHLATVVPGVGIWAVASLMVVFTALTASINEHEIWRRYEALVRRPRDAHAAEGAAR